MEFIRSDDILSVCSSDSGSSDSGSKSRLSIKYNFINKMSFEDALEFEHAVFESIDEYTNEHLGKMCSSNFHTNLVQDVAIHFFELLADFDECSGQDHDYEYIEEFVKLRAELFFDTISSIPNRSRKRPDTTIPLSNIVISELTTQIAHLRSLPQPVQRTKEWYEFRYNLITASSLGKLFGSDSLYNSIICEKCKPLDYASSLGHCSVDSPMHWGTKYEPLTIMLYEKMYQTKIEDFGCIRHRTYPCIGASPDGINVDPASPLYGRMLEVKNIVNREISGIPLDAYWIQMQGQMETCDLDECDFIETQFKEYDESEFYSDSSHKFKPTKNLIRPADSHSSGSATQLYAHEVGIESMTDKEINPSPKGADLNLQRFKGVVLYFVKKQTKCVTSNVEYGLTNNSIFCANIVVDLHSSESSKQIHTNYKQYNIPHYVFMPLTVGLNKESVDQWIAQKKEELRDTYTLYTTQYWYLDKMSCVLVQRNRAWFNASVSKIVDAWATIEKERVSGWEHRLPKKYIRV